MNIAFKICPIGFEQSNFTGECICDHRLWQYTNSCGLDRRAILRNATSTFWLSVTKALKGLSTIVIVHLTTVPVKASISISVILMSSAISIALNCCVGNAKKGLVLYWAAPNV